MERIEQKNRTDVPEENIDSKERLISYSVEQLEQLLEDYSLYMKKDKELSDSKQLAKTTGVFNLSFNTENRDTDQRSDAQKKVHTLERQLQEISNRMRFQNPIIWMWYKAVAYVNTPKANLTVKDFSNHLKASGEKICDVRMMFFESKLPGYDKEKYPEVGSYFEEYFGGETSLYNVAMSDLLIKMSTDKFFMTEWSKWENFSVQNPDGTNELDKWKVGEHSDFKTNSLTRDQLRQALGII
jgi:hypothetical protein